MGKRELNILAEARVTLGDTNVLNPRWSNERLMGLLSEGQDDMCKAIPIIAKKATINTAVGQDEYYLPDGSVRLLSASSDGTPLTITSYDEIERDRPEWEADTASSFTSIIVNALSQQTIRPYPMLSSASYNKAIKVRYHAMPVQLGWVAPTEAVPIGDSEQELTVNDMWDFALRQYVIGMAFLDYGDEASISRSQVALGLYTKDFTRADRLAKKSFAKRVRTTGFQGRVASNYRGDRYGGRNSRFRY